MRYLKNKKGEVLLRDVIMFLFLFSGVVAFASIFVSEMGTEYGNTEMISSYNQDAIGSSALTSEGSKWESIGEDLSGDNGVIKMLTGSLEAIGNVLFEVLKAPATFSTMLTSTLDIVGASDEFQNTAGFILTGLLYVIIIFGIVKVFLRGGDI